MRSRGKKESQELKGVNENTAIDSPVERAANIEIDAVIQGTSEDDKIENNVVENSASQGPLKVLKPMRTDAIKALQSRQRRLERLCAASMPEVHYVGQIISGKGLVLDASEGACCRWKVDHGKAWEHLGGDIFGQTQISYSQHGLTNDESSSCMSFNHPLDMHYAVAGLQGWAAPRITVQCYRMDWHGRRLLSGYGFAHLPTTPGLHRIEICLWRPVGSSEQELEAHLLGCTPALTSHEPVYESAWRERCRLVTVSAGKVYVDMSVITRFLKSQGVDSK